jgi:hypothetical protein
MVNLKLGKSLNNSNVILIHGMGLRNLENSLQPANHDQTETNDIQASTRKLQREADAFNV